MEHAVERQFLRPVYLGESILPFRAWKPFEGVIPLDDRGQMLDAKAAADQGWSGLGGWMRSAEEVWTKYADSDLKLVGRWNYHNELGSQWPIAPLRVVYAKAGTQPAACILYDSRAVVDHKLYWAVVENENEANFLTAILNSEESRRRIEGLQSRGLFGARDFDKVMFTLPIPRFSDKIGLHAELAATGREAETLAAAVAITPGAPFQRARRTVRDALRTHGVSDRIDALVRRLLDEG